MNSLDELAMSIDAASKMRDSSKLLRSIDECDRRLGMASSPDRVLLHYFRSNAYAGVIASNKSNSDDLWSWDEYNSAQVAYSLRRAINEPAFKAIELTRACQIRTNLANWLSTLGRPIAANEQWLKVLEMEPLFAKALANRAEGLLHYASAIYDENQMPFIQSSAKIMLERAIREDAVWESGDRNELAPHLRGKRDQLAEHLSHIGHDEEYDWNEWDLGDSDEERSYRRWCLDERLFLNPLNDVCAYTIAAHDVLHLPNHSYFEWESPRFPDYFNLMKLEYVCARFRLYSGIHRRGPKFVSRDVHLLKGAIDQILDFNTEDLRSAYRSTYSIFDKIALFINDYFQLGLKPRNVSFCGVWSAKENNRGVKLRKVFEGRSNWVLRGLFFLSKDLFDESFGGVAEPDAFELSRLRQQMEHRFLSVQSVVDAEDTESQMVIAESELTGKALRLLKLAREALVYTSLAMHAEESVFT